MERHLFGLDQTPNWVPEGVPLVVVSGRRTAGVCAHGDLHIITVPEAGANNGWLWTHLCDGCCRTWLDP